MGDLFQYAHLMIISALCMVDDMTPPYQVPLRTYYLGTE